MLNYKWAFYAFLLLDLLQKKIKIKHASPPQQRLSAYPQCLSASSQTPSSAGVPKLGCRQASGGDCQGAGKHCTDCHRESTHTVYRTHHVYSVFKFSLPMKRRAALQPVARSPCNRKQSLFLPKSRCENLNHRSHRSRLNPRCGPVGAGQPRARSCCHQIRPRTLRVRRQKAEL